MTTDTPFFSLARLKPWMESPVALGGALLAAAVLILSKALFSAAPIIASSGANDLDNEFIYWRLFGFEQLSQGHIALWNPYTFSGTPFLGGWQTGILYPPDLIYLFLPIASAINVEILLHVFWVGFGVAIWARYHKFHPLACFTAGLMTMFGGSFFLHVYAGHLATLDTMAWVPWILLSADQIMDNPSRRPALLLTLSFGMALLGGHPQTLFNAIVTLILYILLRLPSCRRRIECLLIIAASGIASAAIVAVQIDAGLAASAEGTRQSGITREFAAMFSMPPENLLTLIAPWLYGHLDLYWGRSYAWESSIFVGVAGTVAAVFAIAQGRHDRKWTWCAMAGILLLIALSAYTPLFGLLYRFLPGFNRFRGHSKFDFDATLFISMLAAMGFHELLTGSCIKERLSLSVAAIGAVLIVGSVAVGTLVPDASWYGLLKSAQNTTNSYQNVVLFNQPAIVHTTRLAAAGSIAVAGGLSILIALSIRGAEKLRVLRYSLPIVAACELLWFASGSTAYFDIRDLRPPYASQLQSIGAKGNRYLILMPSGARERRGLRSYKSSILANFGIAVGASSIWGYDPTVLERYAEFMAFTQNQSPNDVSMYMYYYFYTDIYRLLRCTDIIIIGADGKTAETSYPNPLPHAFFAPNFAVRHGRTSLFQAIAAKNFDPGKLVYIEKDPSIAPGRNINGGSVSIVQNTSDRMTITTDNSAPALLVITDNYSKYWTASPLPGDSQHTYQVLPADYTVMAVPLTAGHHIFSLEYRPPYFTDSIWLSLVSTVLLLAGFGLELLPKKIKGPSDASTE